MKTRVGSEARIRSRVNSFFDSDDLAVADHDLAAQRVDDEVADPAGPVAAGGAAPQDRADPRAQLAVDERLRQVVVGPGVEAADLVGVAAAAGEDDHRQARVEAGVDAVGLADLAQDVEAGGVGQGEVEQEQVRVVVAAEAQRVGGAGRGHDAEAVGGEVVAEQLEGHASSSQTTTLAISSRWGNMAA